MRYGTQAFSKFGEIEDVHLVREEDTGKSRGFAFLKYEDARSCVLAVDNLCGASVLGRSLRVDHVEKYRLPKKLQEREEAKGGDGDTPSKGSAAFAGNHGGGAGHAYEGMELENNYNVHEGVDLFAAPLPRDERAPRDGRSAEKLGKTKRKEERQRKGH